MVPSFIRSAVSALTLASLLSACGGGGGGSDDLQPRSLEPQAVAAGLIVDAAQPGPVGTSMLVRSQAEWNAVLASSVGALIPPDAAGADLRQTQFIHLEQRGAAGAHVAFERLESTEDASRHFIHAEYCGEAGNDGTLFAVYSLRGVQGVVTVQWTQRQGAQCRTRPPFTSSRAPALIVSGAQSPQPGFDGYGAFAIDSQPRIVHVSAGIVRTVSAVA